MLPDPLCVHARIGVWGTRLNINMHMYITSARGHELSGRVRAYPYTYMPGRALHKTIDYCKYGASDHYLGLLFSWLHTLHCTVVITLGNLPSFPSSSCLVHNDTMIMQF